MEAEASSIKAEDSVKAFQREIIQGLLWERGHGAAKDRRWEERLIGLVKQEQIDR